MGTVSDWQAAGWLVSDTPVKRSVTFAVNGEDLTADVWVRQLSIGEHERIFTGTGQEGKSRAAIMISECIRLGDEGTERLSQEHAYQLHPAIANALVAVIVEVNGLTPAKN